MCCALYSKDKKQDKKVRMKWRRHFPHPSRPPWTPPASYTMGTGCLLPGVKWPGRGVNHPPPSSTEVKERVELYLYSPTGPSQPVLGRTLPCLTQLCKTLALESLSIQRNEYVQSYRLTTAPQKSTGYRTTFMFVRSWVRILASRLAILTEVFVVSTVCPDK